MEINIRHAEPSDYKAIKAIYQQPSCYAGTLQHPYPSDLLWQKRLAEPPEHHYSLVAEVEGHIVGQIGLGVCTSPRRKHAANFGMGVSEAYQGKGVGSALLKAIIDLAFNWLAVTRIELEVYTDNQSAIALYQKMGFVIEGTAKQYALKDGQYVDTHFMALLKQ